MNKILITLIVFVNLLKSVDVSSSLVKQNSNDSFITKFEYGKMLYENPRGVSCKKCHGIDAKGKTVAKFFHKTKHKIHHCAVRTRNISKVDFKVFLNKLDPDIKTKRIEFKEEEVCKKLIYGNTMPKYFLTKEELSSLYYYISNVSK